MSARRGLFAAFCLWTSVQVVATAAYGASRADVEAAAEASEISDSLRKKRLPWKTLAERIPAVSNRAFQKDHRPELDLQLGLSATDPFFRYVIPRLGVHYYFTEVWGAGIHIGYDGAIRNTPRIADKPTGFVEPNLNHPNLNIGIEGVWAPIYGKISWLAENVSHFDTYLALGASFIMLKEGSGISGDIAIGQHYYMTSAWALKLEVREQLYAMARDSSVTKEHKLESLLVASVGISFFVPSRSDGNSP